MTERRQTATAGALTLLLAVTATAGAAGDPGQRCAATKIAAAGKEALCLLALDARAAGGRAQDPGALQRCRDRLADPVRGAFVRAELRGGCAVGGDAALVDGLVGGLEADLGTTL